MKFYLTSVFVIFSLLASSVTFRFENTSLISMKVVISAPGNSFYVLSQSGGSKLSYIDSTLNLVWQKTISITGLNSMSRCMNGDLLFTGTFGNDIIALRTDSLGNTIWKNLYSHSPNWSSGKKIIEHSSGDIFITGSGFDSLGGYSNMVFQFIKLDPAGNVLWSHENSTQYSSSGFDLIETTGSQLIVAYQQSSLNGYHGQVEQYDVNGTGHWWCWISNSFSGQIAGDIERVCATDAGGCIAYVVVPNQNVTPAFILYSINGLSNGIEMQYEVPDSQGGTHGVFNVDIIQTADHGFLLAGSIDITQYQKILLKVDSSLNVQWCKVYPSNYVSTENYVFQTSDQGFLFASNENGAMTLLKTDSMGNAFCNDSSINVNYYFLSNAGPNHVIFNQQMSPPYFVSADSIINTAAVASGWDTLCYDFNTAISKYTSYQSEIYPNPASNQLYVDLNRTDATQLEIYELTGERILSKIISGQHTLTLNCESFPSGLYYLSIVFKNGEKAISKVAIMR